MAYLMLPLLHAIELKMVPCHNNSFSVTYMIDYRKHRHFVILKLFYFKYSLLIFLIVLSVPGSYSL